MFEYIKNHFKEATIGALAVIIAAIITAGSQIVISIYSTQNENKKEIKSLQDKLQEIENKNEIIGRELVQQGNNIDKLRSNLLFIYTRSELPAEVWKNEITKQKNKTENDLSLK